MIKTIIGNLHKNCICMIKKKIGLDTLCQLKKIYFQKLDDFKLENINKRKFIKLKKKIFKSHLM